MNTLTSAPCTSRTSPKNKEPRLARDRRGKLGWRGIDEAGTHTCAREGKSQWEGRDESGSRIDLRGFLQIRSIINASFVLENFRSGNERKEKRKEQEYSDPS